MPVPVNYFTDVEGNFDFFLESVARARHLHWTGTELVLEDGAFFVFGGDGGDKGYGTLRFYRAVVNLKKKHPDRVFLIIGNRDANKLRFLSEFAESDINLDVPIPGGVTGDVKTFREFLRAHLVATGVRPSLEQVTDADLQTHCTAANKMLWTLNSTMGAQGDFEMRREELKIIRGVESITDAQVVQSYIDSVTPGSADPCVIEYLRLAVLAVVIDSTLYVHGGIFGTFTASAGLECCIGHIHGRDTVDDLHLWVATLNLWCQNEIEACLADPGWKEGRTRRSGSGLIDYSAYGSCPSVIMAKPLNDLSQPIDCPPQIADVLIKHGINRVVCGHTPHGTCPTVIRNERIETLLCDTSYSDMKCKDNRGAGAWEVFIYGDRSEISGRLPDLRNFSYVLSAPGTESADADPFVGRGPYSEFWVKAKLVPVEGQSDQYLLCKVAGRSYEYRVADVEEVRKIVLGH